MLIVQSDREVCMHYIFTLSCLQCSEDKTEGPCYTLSGR